MKLSIFILLNLFVGVSTAQNNSQKLDSLFNVLHSYGQINGNVLVAENGKPIYKKSFGFADFKNKVLNSETSRFNIASVSKTFTAVSILQLKEKGKIDIDKPVKKYLPEFPYDDITIRHLISHTSGLPDYYFYDETYKKEPLRIYTNKDILQDLNKFKFSLSFKPGEKWDYANINYCLLAEVVEKVSGQNFEDYLQKNIFSKAKMFDTYLLKEYPQRQNDTNRVQNHKLIRIHAATPVDIENNNYGFFNTRTYRYSGFNGEGKIVSTTNDLLKYDQSLYNGILLKQATLEEAFTPTKLKSGNNADANIGIGKTSFGLGWFIFDNVSNGKIVWHTGGVPGTLSIFLRNISKNQTVILLDNAFSNGVYKNGVNAMSILNNTEPALIAKRSIAEEYGKVLVSKGIDSAFFKFQQLKDDSVYYFLNVDDMIRLGEELLEDKSLNGNKNLELALEVFKLNILLFPNNSNAYDWNVYSWYAYALAQVGRKEEAVWLYQKSLKIKPNDEVKRYLEELLKSK
jgi:CubicO group peptidase (beta-lactamase class C family)